MKSRLFLVFLASLALPAMSHAHFLWASLDLGTHVVSIGLQEVPEQDPLPLGPLSSKVKAFALSGPLDLTQDATWFRAPSPGNSVAASLEYGVVDRRASNRGRFLLKYCAKAAASFTASRALLGLPVELAVSEGDDGHSVLTVTKDGKLAADAEVVIEDKDGKKTFEAKTGLDGSIALPAGAIRVRALITENKAGVFEGKPYDLIRTYSTLTVPEEKLTRLLRESFGSMHEAANTTAFIRSVQGERVTQAQLEEHMRQRALIHEAVDRVLGKVSMPAFGPQQREVTGLLRADFRAMHRPWPAPSQALPLTKKLVAEILGHGPYYALGVFHVYYGGITHGGRATGGFIHKHLNAPVDYYLKSDGYDAYAAEVDKILDPAAQREMILGADDAYRYVIALNNLPVFEPRK